MIEALALIMICAGGVAGLGFAINFFWQTGLAAAFKYAAIILGATAILMLSGLWITYNRYSWGYLTPILALMLAAGLLAIKLWPKFSAFLKRQLEKIK